MEFSYILLLFVCAAVRDLEHNVIRQSSAEHERFLPITPLVLKPSSNEQESAEEWRPVRVEKWLDRETP